MPITNKVIEKDLGWKNIKKQIKILKHTNVKVGLFGNGNPSQNVAARGAVHEFGSPKQNIPSRPFERQAFDNNINNLKKSIKKEYNQVLAGKLSSNQMMKKIGVLHEDQIKKTINDGNFVPLSPKTIARKKSSKPLIDTAVMINSIQSKVENK